MIPFSKFPPGFTKATAGTDLVKKCIQNLCAGTSVERLAVVDGYGYDASPALTTLEARVVVFQFIIQRLKTCQLLVYQTSNCTSFSSLNLGDPLYQKQGANVHLLSNVECDNLVFESGNHAVSNHGCPLSFSYTATSG